MLLSSWGRATQRTAHLPTSISTPCTSKAGLSRPFMPCAHQRKSSSSKSSNPQNDDTRQLAAPTEAVPKKTSPNSTGPLRKRLATRLSRQRSKETLPELSKSKQGERHTQLPAVPSTQHMHPSDVHVASFFSIHRPISVTASVPSTYSLASFSSIFTPRVATTPRAAEVIYTLSSALHTIEKAATQAESQSSTSSAHTNSTSPEESELRTAITQASTSNAEPTTATYLDGQPGQGIQISIQELTKNFRPFMPPPAPVPMMFPEEVGISAQNANSPPTSRSSAIIRILQNTPPSTRRSIAARLASIRRASQPLSSGNTTIGEQAPPTRQPFLERMRIRQEKWDDSREEARRTRWRTLSVKRQRKLKMKKHKYKKLMRRTRNLRRRLDRL